MSQKNKDDLKLIHPILFFFCIVFSVSIYGQSTSDEQLATYYYQAGEYDKAILYYEKLYNENQKKTYYAALFKSYLEVKDLKNAEKFSKKRAKIFNEVDAYLDLALVYEKKEDHKKKEGIYDGVIKELVSDPSTIIETAQLFSDRGLLDYAIKTYKRGSKLLKGGYPFNIEMAQLYEKKKDHASMVQSYLSLLDINESYISQVQASLANSNGFEKGSTESEVLREELLKNIQKKPSKTIYAELLIWLYTKQGNYKMAMTQTKAIDKRNKEHGARVKNLAHIAFENKAFDQAISGYEYIIGLGPENKYYSEAKYKIVTAYRSKVIETGEYTNQDILDLKDRYLVAMTQGRFTKLKVKFIRELAELEAMYLSDINSAIYRLREVITQSSVSKNLKAECKIDLADYLIIKGDVWDASLLYSQAEKAFKYDEIGERAKFKNAKVAFYTGEFEWAKAQLDVLKGSTSKLIANDAMWLSVLISDNLVGDSIELPLKLYASADLLTRQHKFELAVKKLDSISIISPDHALQDEVLYQKYLIENSRKNYELAKGYLSQIIEQYPEDLLGDNAVFELANLYEHKIGNKEKASELFFKILTDYPGSVLAVEARKHYRRLSEVNSQP